MTFERATTCLPQVKIYFPTSIYLPVTKAVIHAAKDPNNALRRHSVRPLMQLLVDEESFLSALKETQSDLRTGMTGYCVSERQIDGHIFWA